MHDILDVAQLKSSNSLQVSPVRERIEAEGGWTDSVLLHGNVIGAVSTMAVRCYWLFVARCSVLVVIAFVRAVRCWLLLLLSLLSLLSLLPFVVGSTACLPLAQYLFVEVSCFRVYQLVASPVP